MLRPDRSSKTAWSAAGAEFGNFSRVEVKARSRAFATSKQTYRRMRLSHAAVVLVSNPERTDMMLLTTRKHYLEATNQWWSKYRGMKPEAVS